VWTGLVCGGLATFSPAHAQTAAGRAFRFDGVNDSAFITNFGAFMPTGAITIEMWLRPEYNTNQFSFALYPDQTTNRLAFSGPWPDGRMVWEHGNTNAGGRLTYIPGVTLSNTWQHFALVSDPGGAGIMRIHRNGVQEAGKVGTSPLSTGDYLGEIAGSTTRTQFFRGSIDEIRVWNVARTTTEIQFHSHRPLIGNEPGLVAYYRCDESTGALMSDTTTNNLDAVLSSNVFFTGSRNLSTAPMDLPDADTYAVTNATATTASLGGEITTFYWTCGNWFEWGPLGFPTNKVTLSSTAPSLTPVVRSAMLAGLTPGTLYEARLYVSNGVDVASGARQFFRTTSLSNANVALPGVINGAAAWGDYDNDGDLDLLLAGTTPTNLLASLFRNDSGAFTEVVLITPSSAFSECSGAWGDYDGDGDLDIVLSGRAGIANLTHIFRNNGGTNFTRVTQAQVPGVGFGSIAWGDYDNDGDLDLLITGATNGVVSGAISRIYRNDDGAFTNAGVTLRNLFRSKAVWGDYSRDGWLDILMSGESSAFPFTNTLGYRHLGHAGGFTNAVNVVGARRSAVAWGDFDRDSDLDFIVAGATNTAGGDRSWSGVYNRISGDTFSLIGFTPLPVYNGSVAWGDYDNDGGLDLVVAGDDEGSNVAAVYRHQSGATFVNSGEILAGVSLGHAIWGDYDNDGDLDLLITGTTNGSGSGAITRLYVNHASNLNHSPGVPLPKGVNFRGTNDNSVQLNWNSTIDLETTNLTYNVRVGTNAGGAEILAPHSDVVTGRRLVPEMGNAYHRIFSVLTNLNPFLTHYWSVQAVDGGLRGGPWSAEQVFHFIGVTTGEASLVTPAAATLNGTVHPYAFDAWGWLEWGTVSPLENPTPPQYLGALTVRTNVSVTISLPALPPLTSVQFRMAASNSLGIIVRGPTVIFQTPWLGLSMLSVSNGLAPGQFNACILSLTNLTVGGTTLAFSFDGGTPAWLGVTGPFSLAASGNATLGLVFNASALTPGTYMTTLVVAPGGGLPVVRVPVTLNVGTPYTAKPGDLNKDGFVDLMELNTVIQYYRGLLP
jgi:hypothetical protein